MRSRRICVTMNASIVKRKKANVWQENPSEPQRYGANGRTVPTPAPDPAAKRLRHGRHETVTVRHSGARVSYRKRLRILLEDTSLLPKSQLQAQIR